jgi:general secretion pathway protein H
MTMSRAGSDNSGASAGFTLLELIMVVLVMALAVGISYTALTHGTAIFQLRSAGRDVLNTFRYAREKAITEQQRLKIVVDKEAQTVVFSDEFGDGARALVMPHHVRIEKVMLEGHELVQEPLAVHFLPNGSSENAEIVLVSDSGSVLRIVTDPVTGGARVFTGQGWN